MTASKTRAIRAVVFDQPFLTNQQVKIEVRRRFGLEVEGNLIIQAVGTETDRLRAAPYQDYLLAKAKSLLDSCQGCITQAKSLLYLVNAGVMDSTAK